MSDTCRIITHPDQEHELAHGAVVLFVDGIAAQLDIYGNRDRMWRCTNSTYLTKFNDVMLPARVIYDPTEDYV